MALFTVEQVELIRRLRSSGITREQVLIAFTELERLEAEFGRSYSYTEQMQNHNMEFSFSSTSVVRSNCTASVFANSDAPNMTTVPNINGDSMNIPYKPNDYFSSQHLASNGSSIHEEVSNSTVLNGDCSLSTSDLPSKLENELVMPSENYHPVSCSESVTQNAYSSSFNCSLYPMEVQSGELTELHELKK